MGENLQCFYDLLLHKHLETVTSYTFGHQILCNLLYQWDTLNRHLSKQQRLLQNLVGYVW